MSAPQVGPLDIQPIRNRLGQRRAWTEPTSAEERRKRVEWERTSFEDISALLDEVEQLRAELSGARELSDAAEREAREHLETAT